MKPTMSETIAQRLAARIATLEAQRIPDEVVHAVERVLLDSLACAMGAHANPSVRALRRSVQRMSGSGNATLWGTGERTSVTGATLVNCTMTRDLDLNDTYFSHNPAHSSDNIGACAAVAEAEGRSSAELIKAILVAFEVQMRACEFTRVSFFKHTGWDQTLLITVASAAAASSLLKLDAARTAHALSIAACYPTSGEVRVGQISEMKSVSAGLAASRGVEAAYLAREGITGPHEAFEGKRGLGALVLGECNWDVLTAPFGDWRLARTCLKRYPAAYIIHSAIDAALTLRREHGVAPSDIEAVTVDAFAWLIEDMVNGMGSTSRYEIDARETADHSLPYCVAVSLVDGEYTIEQLNARRWEAPEVAAMVKRVKCVHDAAMDARFPPDRPSRVTLQLRGGRTLTREVAYPRGDYRDPLTDDELADKFRRLSRGALSPAAQERAIECALDFSNRTLPALLQCIKADA